LAERGRLLAAIDRPVAPIADFLINLRRDVFILKIFDCQKKDI
jgi:hypothetical protein